MARVLVPVEILEGGAVSPGLMTLLGTVDVTVLGYHVLPEQTPADQARLQYEDRASDALEDLSEEFRTAGGDADHRLVFTHDKNQTIDRVSREIDASAFAISSVTGDVDQLLVSLSGDVDHDRILEFVTTLIGGREIGVTLFATASEKNRTAVADRLEAAAERLHQAGITVRTELIVDLDPFDGLLETAPDHDVIVIGEKAPSLRALVFGDEAKRVASASIGPVLVVQRNDSPEE